MRNAYDRQLHQLHDALRDMGTMCQNAVVLAIRAVTEGETGLIDSVREVDSGIDKQEREIEDMCLKLLLQQQPVASDLRAISAALKMISDLERIGDQAADIAEIAQFTGKMKDKLSEDLRTMASATMKMVNDSIDAFVRQDLVLAKKVIAADDVVDDWFVCIKEELVTAIAANHAQGGRYLDLLMVAKYLERIGDHATNVAEWVEYSILGRRSKNGVMIQN